MKKNKTYALTEAIINGIETAFKSDIKGDNRTAIVSNCLIHGLKELYNVDIIDIENKKNKKNI
jgi:hypothetical protein